MLEDVLNPHRKQSITVADVLCTSQFLVAERRLTDTESVFNIETLSTVPSKHNLEAISPTSSPDTPTLSPNFTSSQDVPFTEKLIGDEGTLPITLPLLEVRIRKRLSVRLSDR